MKALKYHTNEFFDISFECYKKKLANLLWEHVDLSQMVVHHNIKYGDHISHVCDIWHLKKISPTAHHFVHSWRRVSTSQQRYYVAHQFAQMGFTVCSINYRLAPEFPCPSGLVDVQQAYLWWIDHLPKYGGSAEHIIVAGDSAGANLLVAWRWQVALHFPCWKTSLSWKKTIISDCHFAPLLKSRSRKERNDTKKKLYIEKQYDIRTISTKY